MSDFNLPVQSPNESIWERFNPRHIWLADQVALGTRKKNDLGALYSNAQMGYTADDQEKMEQQGRLQELTAQFVEQTKDLDDSAYQQAADQFMQQMGAPAPQRQTAELEQPNLAQGGFALLAAALDPQHAADTVAQPFMYQLGNQQQRQGQLDQAYGDQVKAQRDKLGAAETRMTIEERRLGKKQASQDRQANMTRQLIQDVQGSISKLEQRKQVAINQAFTQWNSANTPDEKAISGRRLQTLLAKDMPDLAPTDDEIGAAVEGLRAQGTRFATQEWETSLRNELNAFGEVDEARQATLEAQRMAIAQRYGIDPANLRMTPTAKTVAAQKMALAEEQFKFLKNKTAREFKLKWANYQVAKQRAETAALSVANQYALGNSRVAIAQANLKLREYEIQLKQMAKGTASQAKSLLDEVNKAAQVAAKFPTDANQSALEKKRIDLNQFLETVASEIGLTSQDIISDPLGAINKVISEMEDEPEPPKTPPPTTGKPPLKGAIGGGTGEIKNPYKKPVKGKAGLKPAKVNLPSGWSFD